MTASDISLHITNHFPDVAFVDNFGYRFFFYGEDRVTPFVSLAESDHEYDNVSNLDREGVFRVNMGVTKDTFKKMFSEERIQWDYTETNQFMPHSHYAAQNFVCVLNPTGSVLDQTMMLIQEAYHLAKRRSERKQTKDG